MKKCEKSIRNRIIKFIRKLENEPENEKTHDINTYGTLDPEDWGIQGNLSNKE